MDFINLGKTNLLVSKTSFGALPIQRVQDRDEALHIIRSAYEGGINFFDTARAYTDSETKLGYALFGIRKDVIIATKTQAKTGADLLKDLHASLDELQTDYIDLYQLHNPSFVPKPDEPDGLYDALLRAKKDGKIRHIGITNHSRERALEAVFSGLYETVQYPFSMLSTEDEIALVRMCEHSDTGFIAMKALCGGLLTNIRAAFAFLNQFENVVPIWGIQKIEELTQILELTAQPPVADQELLAQIAAEKEQLGGSFCRACAYCQPCPAGIPIETANRMSLLLRRMPSEKWLTETWKEKMEKIRDCTRCGLCEKRCPYHLKPYETLPAHLADYLRLYGERNKP